MHDTKPIFDPATHYRIEMRGRVDVEWLQSFGGWAEVTGVIAAVDEASQLDDVTVLDVTSDQAGIVGLVRQLHGLGIAIQQLQVVESGSAIAPDRSG